MLVVQTVTTCGLCATVNTRRIAEVAIPPLLWSRVNVVQRETGCEGDGWTNARHLVDDYFCEFCTKWLEDTISAERARRGGYEAYSPTGEGTVVRTDAKTDFWDEQRYALTRALRMTGEAQKGTPSL